MEIHHTPVLCNFILDHLIFSQDKYVVDFNLGEGGHSQAFLAKGLKVLAFEQDEAILKKAKARLKPYSNITYINDNFKNAGKHLAIFNQPLDLALFDLGISNFHYRESGRGFSFAVDEELDMRLHSHSKRTAADIINTYPEADLADLFYRYGGEKKSRGLAKAICRYREHHPIKTTQELSKLLIKFYPPSSRIHPATRVFQALRIAVNEELEVFPPAIAAVLEVLAPGGRIAAISYHSLEDQMVKQTFLKLAGKRKNFNKFRQHPSVNLYRVWNKKPILPSPEEIGKNPSARSAKLRVLVKDGRLK